MKTILWLIGAVILFAATGCEIEGHDRYRGGYRDRDEYEHGDYHGYPDHHDWDDRDSHHY